MKKVYCALVGHKWGGWHYSHGNRFRARQCRRCPTRQYQDIKQVADSELATWWRER